MADPMLAEVLRAVNNTNEAVNNLRQIVDSNHKESTAALKGHMVDEEGKIEAFTASFHAFRESSERRHAALIQSINSYMEKQNDIEEAFLVDKAGRRDFVGHKTDHEVRLEKEQTWRRRTDAITIALLVLVTTSVFGWVATLVWKGFLAGPVAK